jgi:NurA-like 5'-3' nuclease
MTNTEDKTTEEIVKELKKIAHEYPCCEFTCNDAVERLGIFQKEVEDVECLLYPFPRLPNNTELGLRLQERLAELHTSLESKINELKKKLTAVTAERDRLRRAAELGLEYAETELQHRKRVYAGYPSRWELDEIYVGEIKAALRGEVQGE